jgi:hypothetical protein
MVLVNPPLLERSSLAAQLSTNSYVAVGDRSVGSYLTKKFTFTAATKNLLVRTSYSLDGGASWTTLDDDISVTTAVPVEKAYTTIYSNLRVSVKSAAAGQHGTLSTAFFGSWL